MEDTASFEKTAPIARDLTVNRLGFGAMRIAGPGVWGPPADPEAAIRLLQRAVELGVNFIDTADSYGPDVSEELIAEALHPYPTGLVIATKGGFMRSGPDQWTINAKPDHLKKALAGSLKRLKLDRIDLYQLHRIDPAVPLEKSLEVLQKAQEEGLINHIGLSEVGISEIARAQELVEIVSVQNKYSFDNRRWEAELHYCRQHSIAFIPWYPLNAGNVQGLEKIKKLAKKYEASGHQIMLNWLLHHSPNILLIPGTSNIQHLEENMKSAALELSREDIAYLEN